MEARFIIQKVIECKKCNGAGMVEHPLWTRLTPTFEKWQRDEISRDDYLLAKLECFGETEPPEEIPCWACGGHGEIVSDIDLAEALRELGFLLPKNE